MSEEKQTDRIVGATQVHLSPAAQRRRRQQVLTQGTASVTHSIADAIAIKDGNLFFLAQPDGDVPLTAHHGFGLYYHDCRYLNGYELRTGATHPDTLVATATQGFTAVYQFTNHEIRLGQHQTIAKQTVGIEWQRVIDADKCALQDLLTIQNYGQESITLPLALRFRAEFEDVFAIRGLLPKQFGHLCPAEWQDDRLWFLYEGADGLYRSLTVQFWPPPDQRQDTTATFHVHIGPRARTQILVSLIVGETPERPAAAPAPHTAPDHQSITAYLHKHAAAWLDQETAVASDSVLLTNIVNRSLRDLRMLRSNLDEEHYFAAGLPWFGTLFGRDSLISAMQVLAYDRAPAGEALRLLAHYQGQKEDQYRDEQPGKILHELRVGEMARLNEIPHTPYYGSIDSTLLFLILFGRQAAWTGDLTLFHELRDNVEQALTWMERYGDINGDGYIEYASPAQKHGLVNQGWKDSGNAIVNADGSLAAPPIALVEVQGYAYLARLVIADLYERDGNPQRADQLRKDAQALRVQFNRDFWLEELGCYALALQADHRPVAVVSSNPGQALWTGICDPDKARRTMERLLAEDMFSGWGIRTLATGAQSYNPISYHLGTVWPHDNALIAAGFRRYGFTAAVQQVVTGVIAAAMHFPSYRLPELFAGFPHSDYPVPVHYPVACHPQAWAAGSVPFMLTTLLGLAPDAFAQQLRIVDPQLPEFAQYIELHRLRVGSAVADLRFERSGSGVAVKVLKVEGDLEVMVVVPAEDQQPSGEGQDA